MLTLGVVYAVLMLILLVGGAWTAWGDPAYRHPGALIVFLLLLCIGWSVYGPLIRG